MLKNNILKNYTKSANKQKNTKNEKFYIYGKHPVIAALNNPNRKVHNVFCLEKFYSPNKELLDKHNTTVVSADFLKNLLKTNEDNLNNQGVVAEVSPIASHGIHQFLLNLQTKERVAILDQITDPHNIGAIIRSAAAFGINTLIVPDDHTPHENQTIAKSSSGCLELVSMLRVTNLKNSMELLKKHGFWIVGLDKNANDSIDNLKKFDRLAIVIGSEGKGMRSLIEKNCDFKIGIPIKSNVESLNASNAAAIVFYELRI